MDVNEEPKYMEQQHLIHIHQLQHTLMSAYGRPKRPGDVSAWHTNAEDVKVVN